MFSQPSSIKFTNNLVETLDKAIKGSGDLVLIQKYQDIFKDDFEKLEKFIRKGYLNDSESMYIYSIVQALINDYKSDSEVVKIKKEQFEHTDSIRCSHCKTKPSDKAKRKEIVESFLNKILKLCSTGGIYAELNLVWFNMLKDNLVYWCKIAPKCLYLDVQLNVIFVMIKWKPDINKYQLVLNDKLESIFKDLNKEEIINDFVNIVALDPTEMETPDSGIHLKKSPSKSILKSKSITSIGHTSRPKMNIKNEIEDQASNQLENSKGYVKKAKLQYETNYTRPNMKQITYEENSSPKKSFRDEPIQTVALRWTTDRVVKKTTQWTRFFAIFTLLTLLTFIVVYYVFIKFNY
jgi:hypothetical protein